MEKKYIIELEDEPFIQHFKNGAWETIYRVKGFNSLVFDWNSLQMLTPYTEPDMEQVRKEAYQQGYEQGYKDGYNEPGKNQQEAYQRGMDDANRDGEYNADDGWYVMQKISLLPNPIKTELFGTAETAVILQDNSFKDALAKLTEYEQEQEEKEEQSVTAEEVMRQYLDAFCKHNFCTECILHTPNFTCGRGNHFLISNPISDEEVRRAYAEVLQKMKEK